MQRKSASKMMVATLMMIACALLTFGVSAVAQSNNTTTSAIPGGKLCSNRTLSGDYGVLIEGTILGSPDTPLRGVTMQHYDGNGNITQVDHVVIGGMPPTEEWRKGSGTYTVNPDCTGAAVLNFPVGPPNLHFVVVNNGKQTNQVVDGNAITAVGTRVN